MKKFGIYLGLIGFILFFAAILFKFFHLQGASALLTLGTAIGISYFAISLFSKELSALEGIERINGFSAALMMIVFLFSFVFKMMDWPGGNTILALSMLSIFVFMLTFIASLFSKHRESNTELLNVYKFSIIYIGAVLIMFGLRAFS